MTGVTPDEGARLVAAAVLGGLGSLAVLAGCLAALRFADVYERLHGVRAAMVGAALVLAAFAVQAWDGAATLRLALLAGVLALTGPALAHLIAHAAHRGGVEPASRHARQSQATR
ncbi:MAG: monovalent cation/H(+) antiporter subunit G [Hyphomonadaceae bacterium]|nr:monovalent cation/H(+) antiporter subunit G [Hyphomonadaceae bacterium]